MHRALILLALLGCARKPAPATRAPAPAPATSVPDDPPEHPRVDAPGEIFGAYQVQHRPADARLLAEFPAGRAWHEDGWSAWWSDGTLWVHRVTCGECRAVQGWTYVVALDDPDAWRSAIVTRVRPGADSTSI